MRLLMMALYDAPQIFAVFQKVGARVQPADSHGAQRYYLNVIKNLKPGVTELVVHLAHDDAEMRAVTVNWTVWDSKWRQRDVDLIASPEFRKALADNHVTLIGWRPIQKLLTR